MPKSTKKKKMTSGKQNTTNTNPKSTTTLFGNGTSSHDSGDGDGGLLTSIFGTPAEPAPSSSSSSSRSSSSGDDSSSSDESSYGVGGGVDLGLGLGLGGLFSKSNLNNKWKRLSEDRMKQNKEVLRKKQKTLLKLPNTDGSTSTARERKTRDEILQTRRQQSGNYNTNGLSNNQENDQERVRFAAASRNCNAIIKSLTVPIPDIRSTNHNNEDGEDGNEGEMRLFAGQCSSIFRKHGMLILQSSSSSQKNKGDLPGSGMLFSSQLLSSLSKKAKSIEDKICQRLNDIGNTQWKVSKSSSTTTKDEGDDDTRNEQNLDMERLHNFQYNEVASRCLGRLDVRYGMNQEPFCNSQIIDNPYIMSIVRNLLGGGGGGGGGNTKQTPKLVYAGLILSFSNSADQPWHQDGGKLFEDHEYFHYTNNHTNGDDAVAVDLPPYALNVFIPLEDVTEELGPTEFLVQSHLQSKTKELNQILMAGADLLLEDCHNDDENKNKISMPLIGPTLKCGDALFYDYRICHRGTQNLSMKDQTRPMLYLMYARPWFHEHLNFGKEKLFPET